MSWLGLGWPWTIAGHTVGAWSLTEPARAPAEVPPPGVISMQTALVWYDSVTVGMDTDAAWRGYGAALASATGESQPTPKSHTIVDLRDGDFGFDDNALSIVRADSLRWLGGEAVAGSRRELGPLVLSGWHQWGAGGGITRGRHSLEVTFRQRASSAALTDLEEQATNGRSGSASYRYRAPRFEFGLRGERGIDRHESLGALIPSVRDGGQSGVIGEMFLGDADARLGGRVEWRRTRVERRTLDTDENFALIGNTLWGSGRAERRFGDGHLVLDVGAGRHGPLDRYDWAPGLSYRFHAGPLGARIGAERLLAPVWSDLAPGTAAFMQQTWTGIMELDGGATRARHLHASVLFGRTTDRAIVHRLPLDEVWLRLGIHRDAEPYDFGLVVLRGVWGATRGISVGAEGFGLTRDKSAAQASIDPAVSGRSWLEWRGAAFRGDLGILLRAEVDGVGERTSEGAIEGLCGDPDVQTPRRLAGYLTLGAGAGFTLAKAIISVRVRNLENRRLEQPWLDCSTGTEALGPGREYRLALTAYLSN